MKLCRVKQKIVSVLHHGDDEGKRVLLLEERPYTFSQRYSTLDSSNPRTGSKELIAVDALGSEPGDIVLVNKEGHFARDIFPGTQAILEVIVSRINEELL